MPGIPADTARRQTAEQRRLPANGARPRHSAVGSASARSAVESATQRRAGSVSHQPTRAPTYQRDADAHRLPIALQVVAVLDVDRELAEGIAPGELAEARRRARARVLELDVERSSLAEIASAASAGWLGLLVLDGLLVRRVTLARRSPCEIFGAGDLCRPWDVDGPHDPLPVISEWKPLTPVCLAILDEAFALRVARWPTVSATLMQRVTSRAHHLALMQAITHQPRTHMRLLMLFWMLADRWGTVTPEGVVIRLPLTHQLLAMLAGSHRPTVTIAAGKLADRGLLIRQAPHRWLLTHQAIQSLSDLGRRFAIADRPEKRGRLLVQNGR